jgi:hypothetical protein
VELPSTVVAGTLVSRGDDMDLTDVELRLLFESGRQERICKGEKQLKGYNTQDRGFISVH